MFALTNKEAERSYTVLLEALIDCVKRFSRINLAETCLQYHADLHSGEKFARAKCFPRSDTLPTGLMSPVLPRSLSSNTPPPILRAG